jgi:pimeloyl-ACP methyl ester carboxylesterase
MSLRAGGGLLRLIRQLAALCLVSIPVVAAAQGHFPSNEDLRHLRAISGPRLSPDGRSVLIEVSDPTAQGGRGHLWLVDLQANTARQLTYSIPGQKEGEFGGEWMPDGNAILFLAHRGLYTQLYELPMNGGEAHPFDIKLLPPVDESSAPGAIPEHAADAWKQSALAYAAHAKTPLLLLQGAADRTDPLGQSEEMFRALRQMGVPVDLVVYPREDHGPLAGGIFGEPSPEPWHGFDGRQRIVGFLDKAFAQ